MFNIMSHFFTSQWALSLSINILEREYKLYSLWKARTIRFGQDSLYNEGTLSDINEPEMSFSSL